MKTTDWYPGTVKPAYVGVYEREIEKVDKWYSYFSDAIGWSGVCPTPEEAYAYRSIASRFQELPWRGLTEPHCKKCGTQMQRGVAVGETRGGVSDFPGGEIVTTYPGGPGRLIDCYKCPSCGWSMTR